METKKFGKIFLPGGSGFIGTILAKYFSPRAEEIIILSRRPASRSGNIRTVLWNGKDQGDWTKELDGADILINLTGKNVNCRYNKANREEIIQSRVNSVIALDRAIIESNAGIKLFIQCASATIYRHAEDRPMDEVTGETGSGFSVEVCQKWEAAFSNMQAKGPRKVLLRIALVMGRHDGLLPRLLNLVHTGLGGKQGSGSQYISWIHEEDFCRLIEWIDHHPEISGTYNCVAPESVTNREMMKIVRKATGIPFGLPSPEWMLKLGAWIIRTEPELVLKSRRVVPKKLIEAGFEFKYANVEDAVRELLAKK